MNTIQSFFLTFLIIVISVTSAHSQVVYFPDDDSHWERKSPEERDLNTENIRSAVDYALENEYSGPKDLRIALVEAFSHEPYHQLAGPVKERGGPAGLIIKDGYIVAEWGDLDRVDMTFSVTKSYLSTLAGLAVDEGMISDITKPVVDWVWDGTFDGEHNGKITWEHLLNQSSDWSGNLWGMYDWADRPPKEGGIDEWKNREFHEPGSYFKYNDVRVNVLAYSLLQVWRRPLPKVLKQKIMDPIGASTTWRWFGYEHSWVGLDGIEVQSVSGGGHSGGGLFINTYDQARFGLLFLSGGTWKGRPHISDAWIKKATEPSLANERYGAMWWLNRGDSRWQSAPETVFYAAGFGGNYIIIDQENDLLLVVRWLEPSSLAGFVERVYEGLK